MSAAGAPAPRTTVEVTVHDGRVTHFEEVIPCCSDI